MSGDKVDKTPIGSPNCPCIVAEKPKCGRKDCWHFGFNQSDCDLCGKTGFVGGAAVEVTSCNCPWHLGMGPNLKCPVHGQPPVATPPTATPWKAPEPMGFLGGRHDPATPPPTATLSELLDALELTHRVIGQDRKTAAKQRRARIAVEQRFDKQYADLVRATIAKSHLETEVTRLRSDVERLEDRVRESEEAERQLESALATLQADALTPAEANSLLDTILYKPVPAGINEKLLRIAARIANDKEKGR